MSDKRDQRSMKDQVGERIAMANHIDAVSKLELTPVRYDDFRPKLMSGDLMFCAGNYLVSEAIRAVTSSPWSHVGIVLRADEIDRVLFLESVEDVGVRFAPISKYVTDYGNGTPYNGDLVVARHSSCSTAIVQGLAEFGADQLTRPYNNQEIGEILARVTLKIGNVNKSAGYICSELVNACFVAAKCPFTCSSKDFVSPEDLWIENSIKPIAVLAH